MTAYDTAGFAHPATNVAHFDITPGMNAADFGAGSGAYIWPLASALTGAGRLYAIDVQQDLLRRIHNEALKRGHHNVRIIWADLEVPGASKIKSSSLDFVLLSNLLFQIENKIAVLEEARRVLRPAARVALIDWLDSFDMMGPHKKDVVTKEAALELAKNAGFELEKEFPAGAHHYGLLLKRTA